MTDLIYDRAQGALDQSPGGTHYPFVDPSQNIEYLIDDLYFYFDEDHCAARPPFYVVRLYGFGEDSAPAESWEHDYDVVIEDKEGTVLFDTNDSEVNFKSAAFGPDKLVLEWVHQADRKILRIVTWTGWGPHDTPLSWPEWFDVEHGMLAASAIQLRVPTLDELRIVQDMDDPDQDIVINSGSFILRNGYNYSISHEVLTDEPGSVVRVLLDSVPGNGLGKYPGCEDVSYVRRIAGVEADRAGNFLLNSRTSGSTDTGCLRVNLKQEEPAENGGIYSGDIRNIVMVPNTLLLDNDCGVCADCEDFIRVYEATRRTLDRYRGLGQRAEAARDQYSENKIRWEANRGCRENSQLRIALQPVAPCLLAVGIGVCNQTEDNLEDFNLTLDFESSDEDACLICESTFRRGNVKAGDPPPTQSIRYKLGGDWPAYTASFDCISTGGMGYLGFYMRAKSCVPGQTVTLTVNGSNTSVTFPETSLTATLISTADTVNCCEVADPPTTTAEP